MPQAYLELGGGNTLFQFGRFYADLGYESAMAPDNFFHSRSYGFVYGEPTTLTGLRGRLYMNRSVYLTGSVTRNWDTVNGPSNHTSLSAGAVVDGSWSPGRAVRAGVNWISGDEAVVFAPFFDSDRRLLVAHADIDLTGWLGYGFAFHDGEQDSADPFSGTADARWKSIAHYLYVKMDPKWSLGVRYEKFNDKDGARIGSIRAGNPASAFGFRGNFQSLTAALVHRPVHDVMLRLEYRVDDFDGTSGFATKPFNDGASDRQKIYSMSLVVKL
jgi:hypothetical protein